MNIIRLLWTLGSFVLLGVCVYLGMRYGWSATVIMVCAVIVPDLSLIGAFAGEGRLRPNRVAFYNLFHSLPLAGAGFIIGMALELAGVSPIVLYVGAAWLLHIAVDRACGFGVREEDGSIRPVGQPQEVRV